jgi:hypothetical protein
MIQRVKEIRDSSGCNGPENFEHQIGDCSVESETSALGELIDQVLPQLEIEMRQSFAKKQSMN